MVRLPDWTDLPAVQPQPVSDVPNLPATDPAAGAENTLGQSIEKVGRTAETIGAYGDIARVKMDRAMADANLLSSAADLDGQIKAESDPAKLTALGQGYQKALTQAAGSFNDPEAAKLWVAEHQHVAAAGAKQAQLKNLGIWRDGYAANIDSQARGLTRSAVNDPTAFAMAPDLISALFDNAADVGVLSREHALARKQAAMSDLIDGRFLSLKNAGQPDAAIALLDQHIGDIPAIKLEQMRGIAQRDSDKLGNKSYSDNVWGGTDSAAGSIPTIGTGTGDGHVAPKAERVAFARDYATSQGVNPDAVVATMAGEGLNVYTGDGGTSFGDFQLHTGGGMGDKALAAGIDIRDPNTWKAQTKFAIDQMAANRAKGADWYAGQWHGAPAWAAASFAKGSPAGDASATAGFDPNVWAAKTGSPIGLDNKGSLVPLDRQSGEPVYDVPGFDYAATSTKAAAAGPDTVAVAAPTGAQAQPAASLAPLPDVNAMLDRIQQDAASGQITPERANAASANIRTRFNHLQAAQSTQRAAFLTRANSAIAALLDGNDIDVDPAEARHYLPPEQADALNQKLTDARADGQIISGMRTASPDQLSQQYQQLVTDVNDPSAANYAQRKRALGVFEQTLQKRQKWLGDDPADYVVKNDPVVQQARAAVDPSQPATFQNYVVTTLAQQARLGVPPEQQHILSVNGAQTMAADIASDPEKAPAKMQAIAAQYGGAWPHVWSDLVTAGKLPAGFQVVGQLADYDPANASVLARALATPDKAFRAFAGAHASGAKSVEQTVTEQIGGSEDLQKYERSLSDSGASPGQVVAIRHAVRDLAIGRSMFQREDAADATEKAIEAVIGHYEFLPNGGARVPKANFSAVTQNAQATLSGLSTDGVSVPALYGASPDAPKPQEYVDMLRAAPTWITSPKADGIMLMDFGGRVVRDRMGNPIQVPFTAPPLKVELPPAWQAQTMGTP